MKYSIEYRDGSKPDLLICEYYMVNTDARIVMFMAKIGPDNVPKCRADYGKTTEERSILTVNLDDVRKITVEGV